MTGRKKKIKLLEVFRVILHEDPEVFQDAYFQYIPKPDDEKKEEELKLKWIDQVKVQEKEEKRSE